LKRHGLLFQCNHAVIGVELISEFRLAAVLQAVHRFM
jgi:hypothetical protein